MRFTESTLAFLVGRAVAAPSFDVLPRAEEKIDITIMDEGNPMANWVTIIQPTAHIKREEDHYELKNELTLNWVPGAYLVNRPRRWLTLTDIIRCARQAKERCA